MLQRDCVCSNFNISMFIRQRSDSILIRMDFIVSSFFPRQRMKSQSYRRQSAPSLVITKALTRSKTLSRYGDTHSGSSGQHTNANNRIRLDPEGGVLSPRIDNPAVTSLIRGSGVY